MTSRSNPKSSSWAAQAGRSELEVEFARLSRESEKRGMKRSIKSTKRDLRKAERKLGKYKRFVTRIRGSMGKCHKNMGRILEIQEEMSGKSYDIQSIMEELGEDSLRLSQELGRTGEEERYIPNSPVFEEEGSTPGTTSEDSTSSSRLTPLFCRISEETDEGHMSPFEL
jgi:hypothetical protein